MGGRAGGGTDVLVVTTEELLSTRSRLLAVLPASCPSETLGLLLAVLSSEKSFAIRDLKNLSYVINQHLNNFKKLITITLKK